MKKYILLIVIIFCFVHTAAAFDSAQVSKNKGPLIGSNLYPFYLPFINLHPQRAMTLEAGEICLSFSNNYANTFNYDKDGMDDGFQFDVDVENTRFEIDFNYGVTSWLEVGVEGSYVIQYGGIFDSTIRGFHDLFGLANAGREQVADNLFDITVRNENGTWIELLEPVSGLQDIVLKAKLNILRIPKKGLHVSLQPAVKIPVGDEEKLLSSGKLDYALNLLVEKTGYNYGVYLNLGWLHLGQPDNLTIFEFNPDLFSYMLSYEWLVRGGWSLYIQADGNTSPFKSGHTRLDHQTGTVSLGFKYLLSPNSILQVSFSEEFFTFATTDIALQTGLTFFF